MPVDPSVYRYFPLQIEVVRARMNAPLWFQEELLSRQWKSFYCSMDPRIDEDHQILFKLLDGLASHRRESDIEDLNPLLDQLIEYTFAHFTREEEAMKAQDYPRLAGHAEQHQAMRKALLESLREVAKGGLAIPVFIQHIKDSFSYHFETDDMTYIAWRKGQNPPSNPRLVDAMVLRDQPAPQSGSMTGNP